MKGKGIMRKQKFEFMEDIKIYYNPKYLAYDMYIYLNDGKKKSIMQLIFTRDNMHQLVRELKETGIIW